MFIKTMLQSLHKIPYKWDNELQGNVGTCAVISLRPWCSIGLKSESLIRNQVQTSIAVSSRPSCM